MHSLNSVVDNILAARHCAVSESGQEFETVGRYGSDESIINKLLTPTDISANTGIELYDLKKNITKKLQSCLLLTCTDILSESLIRTRCSVFIDSPMSVT